MIINLTDEQVQRYTEALERALDCPFIQADDELYDDLLMLQEKMLWQLIKCHMGTTTVPNIHYNKYIQTKHYVNTTPRRYATSNLWRSTGSISLSWWRKANWDSKQQISGVMPVNIGDRVQTKNTLCPITGQIVDMYKNLVTIADDDAETVDDLLSFHASELELI